MAPSTAEVSAAQLSSAELRKRWNVRLPDGRSRKDQVLEQLRSSGGDSSGAQPRVDRDLRGIRLIEEELRGLDFSGCDLRDADFSLATLVECRFVQSDLGGAKFFQANVSGCEFAGATLSGANFEQAKGSRAGFGNAKLERASFFSAELEHVSFSGAALNQTDFRRAALSNARFREADASGADFRRADLRWVDLIHAKVEGANFREADMRSASVRGVEAFETATFVKADIRDVNFGGAYQLRRHIMDEDYIDEFRNRDRWHRLVYYVWWATSDCGRSLLRWGLFTLCVTIAFGIAYQYVDIDYGDHRTWLSPHYYSLVTLTTLGYGDVLPASVAAQCVAMGEVVIGYLMLGGLISILANKMARRAE